MIEVAEVKSVRRYKCGYEVRDEMWDHGADEPTPISAPYTPNGDYIGSPRDAHRLVALRGIQPQKSSLSHCGCSPDGHRLLRIGALTPLPHNPTT